MSAAVQCCESNGMELGRKKINQVRDGSSDTILLQSASESAREVDRERWIYNDIRMDTQKVSVLWKMAGRFDLSKTLLARENKTSYSCIVRIFVIIYLMPIITLLLPYRLLLPFISFYKLCAICLFSKWIYHIPI